MASSGIRGVTRKTGILHPGQKLAVEGDDYGGPKCGSNIFINDDESTYGWDTLSKERGLTNFASKIIVDGVLLYGRTSRQLLDYFITVLDVLKHHLSTLKLKKCKWFQDRYKFVGMDVKAGETQPAQSKNEAFAKLERPNTWEDLGILIGIFGFYIQFLPLY